MSLEDNANRTRHTGYLLSKVEKKDYNVMIDEQNLFDQPVKKIKGHMITFEKLQQVKEMITQLVVY